MTEYTKQQNWYTKFEGDSVLKNVHLLIRNEVEAYAGRKATTFAATHGVGGVTLKLIKKPVTFTIDPDPGWEAA